MKKFYILNIDIYDKKTNNFNMSLKLHFESLKEALDAYFERKQRSSFGLFAYIGKMKISREA